MGKKGPCVPRAQRAWGWWLPLWVTPLAHSRRRGYGGTPWVPPFFLKVFTTTNITIPPLIPVALISRLSGMSGFLHWQMCCPWPPNLCKRLCSGEGACQPLSPYFAPWVKYQTVGHPWGWAWSMEWGIQSASGPALWSLRRPDHRRWRGCPQWIFLDGEKSLSFPVLWLLIACVWCGVLHIYMQGRGWWWHGRQWHSQPCVLCALGLNTDSVQFSC